VIGIGVAAFTLSSIGMGARGQGGNMANTTRVLSLDDDPEILMLLGLMFELAGYEHLRVTEDERALDILHSEPVDLFTQDCLRPGCLGGLALYECLKADERLRHIPVLFISAVQRPAFAEQCWVTYGDGYLIKPFAPPALLRAVESVLTRHGKYVPTAADRAARYEQVRVRLRDEFGVSTEQIEVIYKRVGGGDTSR
jgi:CheY-like chemotaxis protein